MDSIEAKAGRERKYSPEFLSPQPIKKSFTLRLERRKFARLGIALRTAMRYLSSPTGNVLLVSVINFTLCVKETLQVVSL